MGSPMSRSRRQASSGFTLVEVIIAMAVLLFGMLAVLALFGVAVGNSSSGQEALIAKQKAREALEAIYAARNDAAVTFAQIANDTSVPPGIFKTGFDNLYRVPPNSNGILGTATEGATLDFVMAPDAAGNLTQQINLTNFTRQIAIAPLVQGGVPNPNLKIIVVTVRVQGSNGSTKDYTVSGYISSFR